MTLGVPVRWLAVASTLLACRPPAKPVEPAVDPTQPVIDEATYESKIAGLRATLARSAVALETQAVIRSCNAQDARGCMRCDLATRAQTGGVDPDLIDGVAIALARYPTKVLAAAHLEHVALPFVQPRQHEHVVARLQAVEPALEFRVDLDRRIRSALVALARCALSIDQTRADDSDRAQCVLDHDLATPSARSPRRDG